MKYILIEYIWSALAINYITPIQIKYLHMYTIYSYKYIKGIKYTVVQTNVYMTTKKCIVQKSELKDAQKQYQRYRKKVL